MNIKIKLSSAWAVLAWCQFAHASDIPTAVVNGNIDQRNTIIALTNATVHLDASKTIENATLVLQNERIIEINTTGKSPSNAHIKDYTGMHIYPGFIHMDSSVGLPEPAKKPPFSWTKAETFNSTIPGAYNSNEAIKAAYDAAKVYTTDTKLNAKLRAAGFTSAVSHRKDGIMRGTSVLTHLADQSEEKNIISSKVAQHYSFDKGSSKQDYPVSLMGAVALIRQTWLDAKWYQQQNEMIDFDLAAIQDNKQLPKIIASDNWQQSLLANKIAAEFNTHFIVRTDANSYQNLPAISQTKQTLIVPLSAPDAPEIHDELDIWNIDFNDLKKWEVAPFNAALLEKNSITFALIPNSSPKGLTEFLKDLRKAHKNGLSEKTALAALTAVPAKMLGQTAIGTIDKDQFASFIVTDGSLLNEKTQIAETWVAGTVYSINGLPKLLPGQYELSDGDENFKFDLSYEGTKMKLSAIDDTDKNKYEISPSGNFVNLTVEHDETKKTYFSVIKDRKLMALDDNDWQLNIVADLTDDSAEKTPDTGDQKIELPTIPKPFSAYGLHSIDSNNTVLIKNATVWTNEAEGVLENTDVLVQDGQIKQVGLDLSIAANQHTIDGSGMHLTSGIIDEHTHIALLSVNDVAVNSSMVRMQDVVNPHDINIYRNLAGGVTAAQLLHGSANPIGGQSALVKLKWGVDKPEDMLIKGADGFIKFALGENVKRSRSNESIRYPLTRMGVEQVYRDTFTQAKAYEQAWSEYNKLSSRAKKKTTAPRKDLVMDATLEVLNQERFVSCHSYVQSEINMLMHVAEDFNFNINTFTHILEGYKLADKMKQHGVGGSTFADWWAYKWEVNYAIPYNASLMNNAGVITAINSDSAEMSRRLNQEAAKSIKYGGLSEQDAWKLVTLNPAKLLHLDKQMGSIKVGKDADLVLWSDNPLSIYAKAEKTMIDGVVYFDRSKQAAIEAGISTEKQRLIELSKNSTGKKASFKSMPPKHFECESLTGYHEVDQLIFSGAQQ